MALSGLLAALAVAFLWLAAVFPVGSLGFVALAGAVTSIAAAECGRGWAFGVYVVTSILGWLLAPSQDVLIYIGAVGWYAIVKTLLDRIQSERRFSALRLAAKCVVSAAVSGAAVAAFLLFPVMDELIEMSLSTSAGLLLVIIVPFAAMLVYDYALGLMLAVYMRRRRK